MKLSWPSVGGWLVLVASLAAYAVFLATPINLVTADIGRHVTNGQLLLEGGHWHDVLYTNLYSYTHPDFSVINHHWASGVLFAGLHAMWGWLGVHGVFIALSLLSMLLFADIARRLSSGWLAGVLGLILLPFIVQRLEVRPEVFSYLFTGAFLWILVRVLRGELSRRWLWVLPVLEILWANLHVYFPFGVFLIGIFGGPALLRRDWPLFRTLLTVGVVSALVTVLTPFGVEGALYPFFIFGNYGYTIVENQSIFFLEDWGMHLPTFTLLRVWTAVLLAGLVYAVWHKLWWDDVRAPLLLFGATVTVLAWFALRNFTLFGLVLMPVGAVLLQPAWLRLRRDLPDDAIPAVPLVVCLLGVAATAYMYENELQAAWRTKSVGLLPGVHGAANFVREHTVPGPIFNNYDNGGYLIYELYPEYDVFVDNRPEAYPSSFFQEIYIPMQTEENVWQEQLDQHDFNSIVFFYRDQTNWAQDFLRSRLQDDNWVPVYADEQQLILLRDNEENAGLISEFAIDKSVFRWR